MANFDLVSAVRGSAFKGDCVGIMVLANERMVFSFEGLRPGQQNEGHCIESIKHGMWLVFIYSNVISSNVIFKI